MLFSTHISNSGILIPLYVSDDVCKKSFFNTNKDVQDTEILLSSDNSVKNHQEDFITRIPFFSWYSILSHGHNKHLDNTLSVQLSLYFIITKLFTVSVLFTEI